MRLLDHALDNMQSELPRNHFAFTTLRGYPIAPESMHHKAGVHAKSTETSQCT